MPPFINKSWPILLLPLWWLFWILGLIFHNGYLISKNIYHRVKPEDRRDPTDTTAKSAPKTTNKKGGK